MGLKKVVKNDVIKVIKTIKIVIEFISIFFHWIFSSKNNIIGNFKFININILYKI